MLFSAFIAFSQSVTISNIFAAVGVLILALCSAFFWYQWKVFEKYRGLPSQRLEAKILLMLILKKYPKDSSITKILFQILVNSVKEFREKGICVLSFPKPVVFVYSAELMKDLVNSVDLADKSSYYDINKQVFGNGLAGSKHELWKAHRKLLDTAFKLDVLKGRMSIFNRNAFQLAQKLETVVDKPVGDVWEYLKYSSFVNMADFVLGLKFDDERHALLVEKSMKAVDSTSECFVERIFHPWLHQNSLLPVFPAGRKYLRTISEADYTVQELVDELIANRQKVDPKDIKSCANIILNLHLEDHILTQRDVRDHMATLAAGAYDTASVTMLWCFYTLGLHPEVQEKAYCEVDSLVSEGDIAYDDLAKLKYLGCVIKETLRLYPAIPVFGRKAKKEIQCGQYTIPKGAEVGFFVYMLHRDTKVFQEPEKFDPERFMDSSAIRSWMYTPFAEGYRNCIGKRFAIMEIKVQLVHVLRRFRITTLDKIDETDFDWTIILKPHKCIRFLFEKRHSEE